MDNKKHFISTLLFLGLAFAGFAQTASKIKTDQSFLADYVSKIWTTEDGLPGMSVTTVLQDQKGYIWIGTYDGLVRFDGVEFTTFSRTLDPKFDFASARSLYEAEDGTLWVGHNDEGITSLSPDGEIKKYTMDTGLPNNKVNSIYQDRSRNIWVGTASGVCYITPDGVVKTPNGLAELGQEKILVTKLFCDKAGRIWITTGNKNELFTYENNKLHVFDGIKTIKNPAVKCVTQDDTGAFWFGLDSHYVVRIKNAEETLFDIAHDHHEGTDVTEIIQDNKGNIWFGMDSGITILHNSTFTYFDKRNGLSDDIVSDILEDREGNIWICFDRGGLQKVSRAKFSTVSMSSSVNVICEDTERQLTWLGTDNGVAFYKNN